LQKRGFKSEGIIRYAYRPFDVRWLYWEEETKLLDEKRTEYLEMVSKENTFLFTTGRTRKDLIEPALTTNLAIDLNYMDSGARGFPLYLEHRILLGTGEEIRANVRRTRVQQNNPLGLPHDRNRLQTPAQTLR
jgi:predicted helicase